MIISFLTNRRRFGLFTVLFAIAVGGLVSAKAFVHPGIPLTADDLNAVKTNLTKQPWASGYAQLAADVHASTNYTMQGPFDYVSRNEGGTGVNINLSQWDNDMQAIYYLSLMWYFTSNSAYAQKSHDIMMAWANTLTNFGGYEGVFQLGGTAQRYVTGADILRGTWPGWTTSDTTNLQRFFTNVYWPPLSVPKTLLSANQGGFQQMGAVAIAAFCDDTNKMNEAIYSLVNDGDTGFRDTLPNGEVGDTQRDQGHSYNMVWELAWPAEVLWKQGIDLFSTFDNRILATSEYYCRYNVPGPTPPFVQLSAPFTSYMTTNIGGAPRSSGQNRLVFNIVHGAYAVRKGIATPWTELYRNDLNESADSFVYRKVADASTATPLSLPMTFPPTASLTTGLTSANLNGATPAGSTSYNSGTKTWTLSSGYGGKDPWSTAGNDTVRFAYKSVTGDFTMIAKVTSVANVGSASAKGGLMMRDSLGTATNRVWVGMIASGNYERALIGWTHLGYGANNAQMSVPTTGFPYWVKLERIGQRVHTFTSPNGGDWSPASVADFPTMPSTMYVGLFGASLVTGTASTATFTDVRLTGGDGAEAPKIPPPPFAVYAGAADAQVQLRWNESFNAASYNVKRSTTSGSGYTTVASVTNSTWTDTTVTNGVTHYYVVTAVNAAGESAPTAEASATPQLAMVNIAGGGMAQDSVGNNSGSQGAIQAFDLNPSTKWLSTSNAWLQYDLGWGNTETVQRYALTSANDVPGRDPQTWLFQASTNGSVWTTLDAQANQSFQYRMQTLTYSIPNLNAYRYYRLSVITNAGDTSVQLSELALLALPGTGTHVPLPDLVGWWKFDELSGTTALDSSAIGNNGTLQSAATRTSGFTSNALSLNGTANSYMTLPAGVVSLWNEITLCCWVKVTSSSPWARIFDFGSGTGTYMFLCPASGGAAPNTVRFAITTGSNGGEQAINGTSTLPTGVWKHVAVTLNGSVGILYVDGVAVGTNSSMTLNPTSLGATTQNYLGKSQWSDPIFNGAIDDFRIYRRALSAAEVAATMAPASPANLTATNVSGSQINLSWSASYGATSYRVKRAPVSGGPYTTIATGLTSTNYNNSGLSAGTTYYYVVTAVNGGGESAPSAEASARPVSLTPITFTTALSGNQLEFNWPADHTGWRLEAQTNTLSSGLGTSWFTVFGSAATNQMFLPIDPLNGSVFFRLVYP